MRKIELGLCALLALAGLAHLGGTLAGYQAGTEVFVWSISGSAFVFTVVFLHVLRIQRPQDRAVASAAILGTLVWIGIALGFGAAVGNIADPRALTHVVLSAALLVLAARRWKASRPAPTTA